MQLHIRHETHYVYEETVSYSIQALKLTPRSEPGQRVVSWRVISPGERIEQVDPYGNLMHVVTLEQPHRQASIVVEGVAEISDVVEATPETSRLVTTRLSRAHVADATGRGAARPYRPMPRPTPSLAQVARRISRTASGKPVAYTPGVTDVTHSASEALELGVGVCQDQAHVLVACCRVAGIPARCVSGYFHSGDSGDIASHAWADVWLGADEGWLSLDVTHAEETGAGTVASRSAETISTPPRCAA